MTHRPEEPAGGRDASVEFAKLWGASALSNVSDGIALVAAPLLAATLTGDPAIVAGLAFVQRLPWLLFPLVSGVLVDRIDRRWAMTAVAALRAALIGGLGLAVLTDRASIALLYAVFFLLGVGETVFDIAAVALIPAVVAPPDRPRANARLSGTFTVANQFIGPPLGGFLFGAGAALPFVASAGGLASAVGLLVALRGTFRVVPPTTARRDMLGEAAEGIRWLARHRLLRVISVTLALLNLTLVAQVAIMVVYAAERLGLDPAGFGLLVAAYGVGGTLGSIVASRAIAWLGTSRALRLAVVIETAVPLALALVTDPWVAGLTLCLFGCHATIWGVVLVSLRQDLTPPHLRGRVESAYRLVEHGTAAPGALLGGVLASSFGVTAPFWLGGVVGAILLPFVWPVFSDTVIERTRAGDAA